MPRRRTDFRGLAEPSRVRLLRQIQSTPGSTVKLLAERTGLHVNTVREHLQVLAAEGLVTAEASPSGGRGRPPIGYHPVVDPDRSASARRRIERAREHGDVLRRIMPSDAADHGLSEAALHQLDTLYSHLEDAGLEPQLDDRRLELDLVPCPYYRIVDQDPELACAVHSQILRDTLAQVPGPLELHELRPFVGPGSCLVLLRDDTSPTRAATPMSPAREGPIPT